MIKSLNFELKNGERGRGQTLRSMGRDRADSQINGEGWDRLSDQWGGGRTDSQINWEGAGQILRSIEM